MRQHKGINRVVRLSLICALVVAAAVPLAAQDQPLTPRQAVALAADDIPGVSEHDRSHQFYVWFTDTDRVQQAALAYAINTALSHSANLYKPVPIAGGRLLRIDKRELCPERSDRRRLDDLIENRLAFAEPYTHRSGLVRSKDGRTNIKVPSPSYLADDGRTYNYNLVPIRKEEQFAPHVGIDKMLALYSATGETNMPICRADWLQCVILSTQKVGQIDGLYYDFRGWDVAKTNQDDILRELGASEKQIAEQKITSLAQLLKASKENRDLFRSTSRAGIFHSGVTDHERRVDAFIGTEIRPAQGVGIITLTHDLDRKSVDPKVSPIRNLAVFQDDGREGIALLPNGMLAGWASDGKGALVKSVPEGIAHDATVPHPSPQTLEPIISCLGCHGPKEGFIPVPNDILTLANERLPTEDLTKFDRVNVFDDDALLKVEGYSLEQVREILRSLFGKPMDSVIQLAQQQHGRACVELTGMDVPTVTASITATRNRYVFGQVNAEQALLESGRRFVEPAYEKQDEPAVKAVKRYEALKEQVFRHVPPLAKNVKGFGPEDGMISALRTGRLSMTRAQWELVFPDFMGRAEVGRARQIEPSNNLREGQ